MADTFTAGAYTFGSDDIGGTQFERVKIILGGDGTNAGDMASGAGAVVATVPRVTLASDDPAVVSLQLLDNAISGSGFNITQLGGASVPIGAGTEAAAIRVTLGTDCTGQVKLAAGTAAIGKLAANSGVDIGDVDVLSIAAGTNLIGGVIAGEKSITSYDGTTACTVKRFMVAAPSDGDSLIAAVADKKFRILSFGIWSISGTICRFWLDDADAAVVFGNSTGFPLEEDSGAAPPGFILPHNPHGWFQTATANKALRIQFASGSGVVVIGTYIEVA